MKKLLFISFGLIIGSIISAQVVTTNRNAVGMEHNMLFNANSRYTVTQTGSATLNLEYLFDGKFLPSYTSTAPSASDPTVILVENIPGGHTQQHAVVGWSTRWWPPTKFKIEGYDVYYGTPSWKTLANYSEVDYSGNSFYVNFKSVAPGSYTKLRFTFYTASGTNGRLGVSELFFLHPEATTPYKGLLVSTDDSWKTSGSDLYYNSGNVGIGTTDPQANLHIFAATHPKFQIQNSLTTFLISIANNAWDWAPTSEPGDVVINQFGKHGLIFNMNDDNNDGESYIKFTDWFHNEIMGIYNDGVVRVNGEIFAKEVRIKTDVWSDFVFYSNYDLTPLETLEEFITKNKHLPDIPTEADVKQNGINVAEMHAILLKKIEELTLYIIEQNKKIKSLEARMNELQE